MSDIEAPVITATSECPQTRKTLRRSTTSNIDAPVNTTARERPQTRRIRFGNLLRRRTSLSLENSIGSSASVILKPTLRRCKTEGDAPVITDCSLDSTQIDKLSVSFGSIEIREHGRVLLDQPSCADGLALGIDWKHSKKIIVMKVDEYERKRTIEGKRSNKPFQVLSSYDKSLLLMKVGGYKEKELTDVFRTILHRDKEK